VGNAPNYQRYSIRLNADTRKGKFKFGQNLYISQSDENPGLRVSGTPGANPPFVNDLVWANPTIPIYEASREGGYGGSSAIQNALSLNIIGLNNLVETNKSIFRALAGVNAEYEFIKGLTYKINLQYDYSQTHDELFVPMYDLGFFYPNGSAYLNKASTNYKSGLIENTLKYIKTVNKHNFNILGGVTFQDFNQDVINARTSGLQKPYVKTLSNGTGTKSISEYIENSSLFSLLGRLDYSYDDRYFITANVRRDGSSKFSESNRYVAFPSVALAWKIHNDITLPSFIKELMRRSLQFHLAEGREDDLDFLAVENALDEMALSSTRLNRRLLGFGSDREEPVARRATAAIGGPTRPLSYWHLQPPQLPRWI